MKIEIDEVITPSNYLRHSDLKPGDVFQYIIPNKTTWSQLYLMLNPALVTGDVLSLDPGPYISTLGDLVRNEARIRIFRSLKVSDPEEYTKA